MMFPDESCIAENTLERYYNAHIHEMLGSDWFGIMSLSKRGRVRIDTGYDVSGIGDEYALKFVNGHATELQKQDYDYKLFEHEEIYYLVVPIRVNEHGYIIFFLYLRLDSPFSQKDIDWYMLYSKTAYERLRLNNALIQNVNFINQVLESTESMVTVFDTDYNIITSNAKYNLMLADSEKGEKFSNVDTATKRKIMRCIDDVVATCSRQVLNNIVNTYKGSKHILNLTFSPLCNSKGVVSGVVVVGSDLTQKQMSDYEFEQVKHYSLLGEIALGLAHDLKNPLMNIRNCTSLIKKQVSNNRQRELLEIIDGEVLNIDDIINQLLSFGNVGKQNKYALVDITETLWSCIQIVQRQKAQKSIKINFFPKGELPLLRAKPIHIQQIFLNILLNSLQAIKQDGQIDVVCSLDETKNNICVMFSDNGCGIAESNMENIFSPYFSTKNNGTGLGLFMSKRIIEQYNGSIRVESILNNGTNCTVSLPVADNSNKTASKGV